KGHSVHDVLNMTVESALELFQPVPTIARKLETLMDVGLSYIKLGQSATTLSGGEAQRVKLSKELSRRDTGRTLYILDEPTTGLHFHDIEHLLTVLHKLRDDGNTIVVIEHNLDVIKTADWVIDLGPEGGHRGGEIVAQGTPEDLTREPRSHTGQFLARVLDKHAASGNARKPATTPSKAPAAPIKFASKPQKAVKTGKPAVSTPKVSKKAKPAKLPRLKVEP
ncbi:MAG: excinuclease ABC subunit UvrA, partial [Thermomonas sp.]